MIGDITEEQLQKVRQPIPFTATKRLQRDDVLYVTEDDIPHPIYGYAKSHKEYSVIDLRGYRKGYEPRLEISGIYTPNPEDIFRLQTGKLPPYQPTTTGDKLLAEMRRLGVHKAFRIGESEVAPEGVKKDGLVYVVKDRKDLQEFINIEDRAYVKVGKWGINIRFRKGERHLEKASLFSSVEDTTTGRLIDTTQWPLFIDEFIGRVKEIIPPTAEVEVLSMSLVEYDRQYSLEELREKARQEGLSPSGSKKGIAARLIAKGVT